MKYLLELGADTEVADVGARLVGISTAYWIADLIIMPSKPADLAILRSLGADSTHIEQDIVEAFSQKDDYIDDFEFTPIHIAVLDLYKPADTERPTLEQ